MSTFQIAESMGFKGEFRRMGRSAAVGKVGLIIRFLRNTVPQSGGA